MQTIDTIIHARWIIAGEEKKTILENHALIMSEGKIKDILPIELANQQYSAKRTEKYLEHALIPGLINAHTHLGMSYFKGIADDLALMDWLNNHIWPAEKKWVNNEFVYDASLFAMAEMLRSGTTCFNDMYFFLQATAKAADKAGLRAHLGITVIEFPTNWAQTTEEYFAKGLEFYQEYKNHDRIKATLAPHAPYTVSDKSLLHIKELAEQYDLKINLHLQESADEVNQSLDTLKKRPIKRLHELGFLSPRLIAIHMTQLNDEDLSILQETQPSIVHCPESNMKLASGACPVEKLRQLGINVALGTDSVASNNDLNMIGEMRSAALLAKLITKNPQALSATESLNMATLGSAKALGIDSETGSLTAGKAADVVAIKLLCPETMPIYNPISQIVYASSRQQVTDVWVGGKQLLKNRELTTIDMDEILEKATYWQNKMSS